MLASGEHANTEESWVKTNLRWNFTTLSVDYGLFGLGLSLASTATIMPAFAERLGASNLMIGAIPAVLTLGWHLPCLFSANYIERFTRKLPLILWGTIWERLPLLGMGLLALTLAQTNRSLALVIFISLLAVMAFAGGALMPAWMDLIGKVIPVVYRGRFFGFSAMLGGGLGLGGAFLSRHFLETHPYPTSYALCFLAGFLALMGSFIALSLTREGGFGTAKPAVGLLAYLGKLPGILQSDTNFAFYLASRGIGALGAMATGFYTVFALKVLQVQEVEVAAYTLCLLAAQTITNPVFGFLADRSGHKIVILFGTFATGLSSLAAILAFEWNWLIYITFALFGTGYAALNVSGLNISLEFCPPEDRPTYVGLASTSLAPFVFLAPLLGGWLADAFGYGLIFWLSLVLCLASVVLLAGWVRDPRQMI